MAALITINGLGYPAPISYKVDVEPIGSWERNANGELVGDLIGFKTKLNLTWGLLPGTLYQVLLSGVTPFFVTVSYLDPRQNAYTTGEFYASPRSGTLALWDADTGETEWKEVSFNLIER